MLKSVDLYKGGFPARYGGRISSVMDIRTKDGNFYHKSGEFSLGVLSSKLFLEGPIKREKSSYALSVRYCNFGIYSWLLSRLQHEEGTSGYYFYDINFKTNFILSPQNRLFLNVYSGDDNIFYKETDVKVENSNYTYSDESNVKWGNTAGSVRWSHFADNGFSIIRHSHLVVIDFSIELKAIQKIQIRKKQQLIYFKRVPQSRI